MLTCMHINDEVFKYDSWFFRCVIFRILKNTFRLRQLDVRGCGHLSRDVMMDLAATDLQQLFCSKCSLLKEQGMDQVVAKVTRDVGWQATGLSGQYIHETLLILVGILMSWLFYCTSRDHQCIQFHKMHDILKTVAISTECLDKKIIRTEWFLLI